MASHVGRSDTAPAGQETAGGPIDAVNGSPVVEAAGAPETGDKAAGGPKVVDLEAGAVAVLQAARTKRAQECMAAVQAVLTAHRCRMTAKVEITFDGAAPRLLLDVEAVG